MQANQTLENKQDQLAEVFRKKGLEMQPITHIQSNIWFQSQLNSDLNIAYNLRRAFMISGKPDINRLQKAIAMMIANHEALRTIFMEVGGSPIKLTQSQAPDFHLEIELPPKGTQNLTHWLQLQADIPFDFGQENLFRFRLFQVTENQYAFLMVVHHIICDGYAMDQMLKFINEGFQENPERVESSIHVPKELITGDSGKALTFWKSHLQSFPRLHNLPLDHPRPAELNYSGAKVTQTFEQGLTNQINSFCQSSNLTPFVSLLSIWAVLVYKLSAENKVVIGFPLSTRDEATTNDIDLLVDTLPLGIDIDPNSTFGEHAKSVRNMFFQAYENRHVSFFELSEQLKLERNLSYHPVYQLAFTFLENKQQLTLGGLQTEELPVSKSRIKMDLEFHIELDHDRNYRCNVHYNTSLFKASTIDQYIQRFIALTDQCLNAPDLLIRDISLVSASEAELLLLYAKGKKIDLPKICVHQVFEQLVPKYQDKVAVCYGEQKLTYGELNHQANQLAHYLLEKAPQDQFIGLFLSPGLAMITGMLGVMKAGKAYVPIDPAYPAKRVNYILEDSGIETVISSERKSAIGAKNQLSLAACSSYPNHNPEVAVGIQDLIYMIYTSGTTGLPKGVPIPHQGMLNYTWSKIDQQHTKPEDVSLQLMGFSFDGFGCETFPMLLTGGTLVLIDKLSDIDLDDIGRIMTSNQVSRFMAVPSTLKLILDYLNSNDLVRVNTVSLGGEKPDQELLEKIRMLKPDVQLFNEYGPTENSIASTAGILDPEKPENIGAPQANSIAVILDPSGNLVPQGVPGELCVGGPGLTAGYFGKPDLTADKFFTSELFPNERLYRTGDLTQWDVNGHIHFIGRKDDQVKVNGVRIELEEIRQTLLTYPTIKDCLISNEEAALEAIIQIADSSVDMIDITTYLGSHLPHYMIPTFFRIAEEFPVTEHGKIDLKRLRKESKPLVANAEKPEDLDEELVTKLKLAWAKVLQLTPEDINTSSNFFDLGGHSLLLGKLVTVINKTTELALEKVDFFKYPSIKALVNAKAKKAHTNSAPQTNEPSRADIRKNLRNKRLKRQH